ncbi:hypothetical protein Q1695_012845 [Nippostrongylus brasiliensis]|nr:hypothetical protein Q1695_012845 [Nippostrongylus brasiliensis]
MCVNVDGGLEAFWKLLEVSSKELESHMSHVSLLHPLANMDMWPASRLMNRMMYDTMRDIDHLERSLAPYWRHADHSVLHVANDVHKVRIGHFMPSIY